VTTAGAVGTYIMGYYSGGAVTGGSTYAGSSISYGGADAPCGVVGINGSGAQSGTWRAMGSTNSAPSITLFVRIA
jgi:hypothetical protein